MATFKINRAEYERLKKLSPEEMKSEIERAERKLAAKEAANKKLKEAIAQDEEENAASEKRIKKLVIHLRTLTETIEAKSKLSKKEVDELKLAIVIKEKKLEVLKFKKQMEIDQLRATLDKLKRKKSPNLEDPSLDQEFIVLKEKNYKLKDEFNQIYKAVEEKELELVYAKEKVSTLQSQLTSRMEYLSSLQQTLKDLKENYQAKYDEKISLELSLKQMNNPQPAAGVANKGCSLFNEVDQSASILSSQYKQLKAKYTRAKEVLAQNENEILKLKSDSFKMSQALSGFISERKSIANDREYYKKKRIQDIKRATELAKANIESSKNKEIHTIANSYCVKDLDVVDAFIEHSKKEADLIQKETDDILINQIPLQRRVNALNIDLNNAKSQLKQLLQENINIQTKINQIEGEKNDPRTFQVHQVKGEFEGVRKVRFENIV